MHPHSPLWHYLWLAPPLMEVVVVGVLIRRKSWREYRWFLAYSAWNTTNLALFYLDHSAAVSSNLYWHCAELSEVVTTLLRFGVIWELFRHILEQYKTLQPLSRNMLRWGTAILFLAAVAISAYAPGKQDDLYSTLLSGSRGAALVQSGLLLLLFAVSFYFRVWWRSLTFGIAAGMAVYGAVNLAIVAIRLAAGVSEDSYLFGVAVMAAFHCSTVIWLFYVLLPQKLPIAPSTLPAHNLQEWNEELQRFLTP